MTAAPIEPADDMGVAAVGLHVAPDDAIDLDAARAAVFDLLVALGQDPSLTDLADTPRRVVAALAESLTPRPFTLTTFPNDGRYDEMVVVRDISFHSLCAHHLLPFHGTAQIGYLPGERVAGLSKLVRVVEHHARRLQTQERLTTDIADALAAALDARGVGVTMRATHLCMAVRGVEATGATTVTTARRGLLRTDHAMRAEFSRLTTAAGLPVT